MSAVGSVDFKTILHITGVDKSLTQDRVKEISSQFPAVKIIFEIQSMWDKPKGLKEDKNVSIVPFSRLIYQTMAQDIESKGGGLIRFLDADVIRCPLSDIENIYKSTILGCAIEAGLPNENSFKVSDRISENPSPDLTKLVQSYYKNLKQFMEQSGINDVEHLYDALSFKGFVDSNVVVFRTLNGKHKNLQNGWRKVQLLVEKMDKIKATLNRILVDLKIDPDTFVPSVDSCIALNTGKYPEKAIKKLLGIVDNFSVNKSLLHVELLNLMDVESRYLNNNLPIDHHTYICQVPVRFTDAGQMEDYINELVARFPSAASPDEREVRFVIGLNVSNAAPDDIKGAMKKFCSENSSRWKGVTLVNFEWNSQVNTKNSTGVNYVGIRNALLKLSRPHIQQAVSSMRDEVDLVTLDPDTKVTEEWLQRAEQYWEQHHPIVTAAHYQYEISNRAPFEGRDQDWIDLCATVANRYDPVIKRGIANHTFLNYRKLSECKTPSEAENALQSNLKMLQDIQQGSLLRKANYEKICQRRGSDAEPQAQNYAEYGLSLLDGIESELEVVKRAIDLYKSRDVEKIKSLEKQSRTLFSNLSKKVSGETMLYPNEAFLIFQVKNKSSNSDFIMNEYMKDNFWGNEGAASESEWAVRKFINNAQFFSRAPLGFISEPTYVSEMPLRHGEPLKLQESNISLMNDFRKSGKLASKTVNAFKLTISEKKSQSALQSVYFRQRELSLLKNTRIEETPQQLMLCQFASFLKSAQDVAMKSALDDVYSEVRGKNQVVEEEKSNAPAASYASPTKSMTSSLAVSIPSNNSSPEYGENYSVFGDITPISCSLSTEFEDSNDSVEDLPPRTYSSMASPVKPAKVPTSPHVSKMNRSTSLPELQTVLSPPASSYRGRPRKYKH